MHDDWDEQSAQTVFIRKVVIVFAIGGLAILLWQLRDMLLLVFGAVLVSVIVRAAASPLHRRLGLSENIAIGLVAVIIVGAAGTGTWFFGNDIAAQARTLSTSLPSAWTAFEARIGDLVIGERLAQLVRDATPSGKGVLSAAGGVVTSLGSSLAGALLVLVGGIYLAVQPGLYRNGLLKLVPAPRRTLTGEALDDSGRALKAWLRGQLFSMAVVAIMVGSGLWVLGVPLAFLLGIIAGLFDFVPLIGPIAAAIPALLLALTVGPTTALWTGALYLLVQQIEGNILSPLVQQHEVDLPPALLLFALLGFGILFGVVGVLLAAPLTVVAFVMIKRLYVREALGTQTSVPGEEKTDEA